MSYKLYFNQELGYSGSLRNECRIVLTNAGLKFEHIQNPKKPKVFTYRLGLVFENVEDENLARFLCSNSWREE